MTTNQKASLSVYCPGCGRIVRARKLKNDDVGHYLLFPQHRHRDGAKPVCDGSGMRLLP